MIWCSSTTYFHLSSVWTTPRSCTHTHTSRSFTPFLLLLRFPAKCFVFPASFLLICWLMIINVPNTSLEWNCVGGTGGKWDTLDASQKYWNIENVSDFPKQERNTSKKKKGREDTNNIEYQCTDNDCYSIVTYVLIWHQLCLFGIYPSFDELEFVEHFQWLCVSLTGVVVFGGYKSQQLCCYWLQNMFRF